MAAAEEKREVQEVVQRLFATLDQLTATTTSNGERLATMAGMAGSVHTSSLAADHSAQLTGGAVQTLEYLTGHFQSASKR